MTDLVLTCPVCRKSHEFSRGFFRCPNAGEAENHILVKTLADTADRHRLAEDIRLRWERNEPGGFHIFQGLLGSGRLDSGRGYGHRLAALQQRLRVCEDASFETTSTLR